MAGEQARAAFLREHPPFDAMDEAQVADVAARVREVVFERGQTIVSPEQGPPQGFFVIREGVVQTEWVLAADSPEDEFSTMGPGQCFPVWALLTHNSVRNRYRAQTQVSCWELPSADFARLTRESRPFLEFCTARIAQLLQRSLQLVERARGGGPEQLGVNAALRSVIRREPVTCSPDTPVGEVLSTMDTLRIGSMIVTDPAGAGLGIFTLHDVLRRVAVGGAQADAPISRYMSSGLVTLPPDAPAYEAMLAMARYAIRHVVIAERGQVLGVVSENDLFGLQRINLRHVGGAIKKATDVESIAQAATDVRRLGMQMLTQGASPQQLTRLISTMSDAVTRRVIELAFDEADVGETRFCWIVLGSEGRYEQSFLSDQDNGIIFALPEGLDAEQTRQRLLPVARRINEDLDRCGFALCKGGIMAGNPMWCLSLEEWQRRFTGWIDQGDPQALLHGSIFFDFRALYGDEGLARELRTWLSRHTLANPRFLHQMAANALRNQPPLGLVRDFVVDRGGEHANTLDLKMNGTTPFVDAARIFSLASGVESTSTIERLRAVAGPLKMPQREVEAWIEAFLFIQTLRLRCQHEGLRAGGEAANRIDPDALNELDRRFLKEAFRQGRSLQSRLAMDYRL